MKYDTDLSADCQPLCSGYGQWHSPNNERNPRAYVTTTLNDIVQMATHPTSTAKANAQWAIFSTLPSRVHSEQRAQGRFYALWADIDEPQGMTFEQIADRVDGCLLDFLMYTTASATVDNPKVRIIAPLESSVSGDRFVILQKVLNDKLELNGIKPDRATERAGQVCYLPNAGEFYRHHISNGAGALPVDAWNEEIRQEQDKIKAAHRAAQEARERARTKATGRMASGCKSPIDAFNAEYHLPMVLESYGYMRRGNRWLSPNSESGTPGVSITDDGRKWLSTHSSDADIGRPTANGTMGDAFDLFVYYQHNGNRDAAIRAAGDMFTIDGETINEANQREYKQRQGVGDSPKESTREVDAVDIFGNLEEPPFSLDLMPEVVGRYAKDQAELLGVDPAVICMTALAVMAGCIDDRIQIQPKRYDPTWRESARLWVAIIGDPSAKKTPGMKKALSPAKKIAAQWRSQYSDAKAQWEQECADLKAADKNAVLPDPPQLARFTVGDVTVEKLGDILSKCPPRGILVDRDELTGWLAGMDAYKNGGGKDRAAWLEAYNGGGMEIDRIGRGSLWVENWSVCVVGGIQPQIVHEYAKTTNHDGMLQRFVLIHAAPARPGVDRLPDMQAKQAYADVIEQMAHVEPTSTPIELSDGAHAVREALNAKLHKAVVSMPNKHLSAMIGKWEGLFARMLLTFHVAECATREEYPTSKKVSEQTAAKVSNLLWRVILPHSIKFYDGMDPADTATRQLAGLILARGWDRFTVRRDLNNNMIAYRKMKEWDREEMLDRLEAYGWIFPEDGKLNERGRPVAYVVNRSVHDRFAAQAETEKKRRANVAALMAELKDA